MTRAIALRMIHAGAVAASPEELEAWIARTDDLRDRLTKAGYGSAFSAGDLFPLFQSFVAKQTAAPPRRSATSTARWLWIGAIVAAAIVVIVVATIAL
jgi:hypothetical protein